MIKKDIIAKLTELGIEHDPKATAKDLEALLPADQREKKGGTEASVYSKKNGALIRTYTQEVHGDDFEALANEFAAQSEDREVRVQ